MFTDLKFTFFYINFSLEIKINIFSKTPQKSHLPIFCQHVALVLRQDQRKEGDDLY